MVTSGFPRELSCQQKDFLAPKENSSDLQKDSADTQKNPSLLQKDWPGPQMASYPAGGALSALHQRR